MSALHFEWDEAKAKANLQKHGFGFEEAKSVFLDDPAKMIPDPDHSIDEPRFILLGYGSSLKLLVVCHCYRAGEQASMSFASSRRERQRGPKHKFTRGKNHARRIRFF